MKSLAAFFSAISVFLSLPVAGQNDISPLVFDSCSFDFGTVDEGDGTLFHTFTFINGSASPVRISNISASCNCVTVSYPRAVLAGGETGTVSVAFNPVGLAGNVQRQIEIFLGNGNYGQTLEISADIVPSEYDIKEAYKVAFPDGLRLESLSRKFGYIPVGHSSERSIDIVNDSSSPVSVEAGTLDPGSFLTVSCPKSLGPGEAGAIIFRYNLPSKGYGSYRDEVQVFVNGSPCNRNLSVTAIGVDDFSSDNVPPSPSMQIYPSLLSVKKIPLLDIYLSSFEISNNGKAPLAVRKAVSPDGVEVSLPDGTVIKPGEKKKVSVKSSIPSFSVEVIANDPVRPYKELRTYKL